MTKYELITTNQSLLRLMQENSISPKDVKYIEMMNEYKQMRIKHHKVIYIVSYLSEKYGMTERSVYGIVNKLSARVKI